MKQKLFLILGFVYLTVLPGCWDMEEIDRRAFIIALGIDSSSKRSVMLTAQLPLLEEMLPPGSAGGSKGGKNFHAISAEANSIFSAFGNLQDKTNRHLVVQQNRLIVIGETMARRGVRPVLDWIMENPKLPPQALLFITRQRSAQEMLSATPAILKMAGLEFIISKVLTVKQNHTYFIPIWRFRKIMLNQTEDLYAPLLDFDFKDGQYLKEGLAVFNGDRLAGELNLKEAQTFGLLTNQMRAGTISYRLDPAMAGQEFALRNVIADTRLKVLLVKGKPHFMIKTEIKGALAEMIGIPRRLSIERLKKLEKVVAMDTTTQITTLIRKLQALDSDPIAFGEQLRAQHYWLWKRIAWKEVFPTVSFTVSVKARILRDGIFR
jgi:spore germination protein KC